MKANIAVVVPAFREERLIGRTLRGIPAFVSQVIVVDDGSPDCTSQAARAVGDPRVRVLRHAHNRGVGAAIVTGYRAAFEQGAEVCAVMAGDAQMDPEDLWALVSPVLRGEVDYAKGDRMSHPNARALMPRQRWLGNGLLSRFTELAVGLRVRDSQCGYTALSARAARLLPLEKLWPRYGYPNDLLGMLAERGVSMREVIVKPVYADEASGIGLRHALLVIPYVLLRVVLRRLVPRSLSIASESSFEVEPE
jgi:glycosyltransferase involved in cell wall biosynthesis